MRSPQLRLVVFFLILLSFLGFGGYYAYKLNEEGHAYKEYMQKSVDAMGGITRLTDMKEYVSMALNGKEMEKKKAKSEYYEKEAMKHEDYTKRWSWFFASIAVAVLLLALTLYLSHFFIHGYMAMMMIAVSMVCLWVGVTSPMMEIFAYADGMEFHVYEGTIDLYFWKKDIDISPELEGKFYFQYQCKSVIDVIGLLFKSGNIIVGVAILLFSIIFPIIKLIISFMAMAFPSTHRFIIVKTIIHKLGKWSMADVFVVAVFLSYLAMQNMSEEIETDAKVLPGLYYFLSFCVLSISSSFFIDKAIRKHDEKTEKILMMQMQRDEINPDAD